jgi:DNA-binding MurR/RpiR family transcriptional regulator
VQRELADQLGPARDRIRQRPPTNLLERVAGQEQDNVARTLQQVSGEVFDRTVAMLADVDRRVWVLPGEVTFPVGQVLALQLGQLREGVTLLAGSEVSVNRSLAALSVDDPLVVIDIHRYERWLVDTVAWAQAEMGAAVVALTDSPLSPLVAGAAEAFFVAAQGVGPFDSMTASLALANALVVGVAARLREPAAAHLDAIEAAWVANRSLVAEPGRLVLPVADGPRSPEPSLPAVVEPAVVEPAGVEPAGVAGLPV